MTKRLFCLLIFISVAANALHARESDYWCDGRRLALEGGKLPLQISALTFTSSSNMSSAEINVFSSEKSVDYYLILIDFIDDDGGHLLTIPFYNLNSQLASPFKVPFARWLYGHSNSTPRVKTNIAQTLDGESSTVALVCPAKARISMVLLQFADGTNFTYSRPDLELDTIVAWAPLNDGALAQWTPLFAVATVSVSEDGHAALKSLDNSSPELRSFIERQVTGWLFSPPLSNGRVLARDLTFLLCFEDVGAFGVGTPPPPGLARQMHALQARGTPRSVIVLHAYRANPMSKTWMVRAGSHYVETLADNQR